MSRLRLFAALHPSAAAVQDLRQLVRRLHLARTAVADVQRWHVTLVFVGEVPPARLDEVGDAVHEVTRQATSLRLRLTGGGRFGHRARSVLYAGVDGEVDALADLAESARESLRSRNLPCDCKPFRPHLTLARPGDRLADAEVAADLDRLRGYAGPEWTATEVVLWNSRLRPAPRYERIDAFELPPR